MKLFFFFKGVMIESFENNEFKDCTREQTPEDEVSPFFGQPLGVPGGE